MVRGSERDADSKHPASLPDPSPLADPGALMATTHEVDGDLRVRLRLARPSDGERVRTFLESLSAETRHRRFFPAMPQVTERLVRHFTFYDPRERLIVVAAAMAEGSERIVGMADVALAETGVAELAVVVDDGLQGQGVGKLLTEVIASLAITRAPPTCGRSCSSTTRRCWR